MHFCPLDGSGFLSCWIFWAGLRAGGEVVDLHWRTIGSAIHNGFVRRKMLNRVLFGHSRTRFTCGDDVRLVRQTITCVAPLYVSFYILPVLISKVVYGQPCILSGCSGQGHHREVRTLDQHGVAGSDYTFEQSVPLCFNEVIKGSVYHKQEDGALCIGEGIPFGILEIGHQFCSVSSTNVDLIGRVGGKISL